MIRDLDRALLTCFARWHRKRKEDDDFGKIGEIGERLLSARMWIVGEALSPNRPQNTPQKEVLYVKKCALDAQKRPFYVRITGFFASCADKSCYFIYLALDRDVIKALRYFSPFIHIFAINIRLL